MVNCPDTDTDTRISAALTFILLVYINKLILLFIVVTVIQPMPDRAIGKSAKLKLFPDYSIRAFRSLQL